MIRDMLSSCLGWIPRILHQVKVDVAVDFPTGTLKGCPNRTSTETEKICESLAEIYVYIYIGYIYIRIYNIIIYIYTPNK